MNWDRPLSRPIRTRGGVRSRLLTLGDAIDMIDEDLSEAVRSQPHWQLTRIKLIEAAEKGADEFSDDATAQLMVALSTEGQLEHIR